MRRKGISAILGTTIALAIVFTIFVPLFIYVQSLQTIFMQEANRRLQYELERIHEKLEVHLSITPPDSEGRRYPFIIIYNPGTLTVSVPTIFIESDRRGIVEISRQYSIAPGEKISEVLTSNFYFSPGDEEDDIIRLKIVTLRGNSFISKEVLGPKNLPYYLIVTLSNMSFGHEYRLDVTTITAYGCVLASERAEPCRSSESVIIIPQSFNDTVRMAAFKVAPGKYLVSVTDLVDNSRDLSIEVEVDDDMILDLMLPEREIPRIAPLRVDAIHKNLTLIVRGSEGKVTIPYIISLETFPEPLKEINVIIELGGKKIDLKTIPKLYPGEMYLGNFTITGNAPGKITYTIRIEDAKGMLSERTYLGSKEADYRIQDYEDGGEIDVCVIEKVQVRVIEGDKETPKDISYVRCDSQEEPPP